MFKRSISEVCDGLDDCPNAKRQSVANLFKPFSFPHATSVKVCVVQPMTPFSTCQHQVLNERPASPEPQFIDYPPSPQWVEPEELDMDFYPDYPLSPVSEVDNLQYESDSDNEVDIDDLRYGSDTDDDGLVELSDTEPDIGI